MLLVMSTTTECRQHFEFAKDRITVLELGLVAIGGQQTMYQLLGRGDVEFERRDTATLRRGPQIV